MNTDVQVSATGLVAALVGVVLVLLALRVLAWLINAVPMREGRRTALRRIGPVAAGVVGVTYALVAVRLVIHGTSLAASLTPVAVVGLVLGLSWFALRDLVVGMFWKAGHGCQVDDVIRVEDMSGRVTQMGFRMLGIETDQGDRVLVPYSKLQHAALVVRKQHFGEQRHVFEVPIPTEHPIAVIQRDVTRMALLCHGTSLSRPPRVQRLADDRLQVTVFAVWSAPVADLEVRVRRSLQNTRDAADA